MAIRDVNFPRFPSRSAWRSRIRLFARRNSGRIDRQGSARHVRDAEIAVWRDPYRRDGRATEIRGTDIHGSAWKLARGV